MGEKKVTKLAGIGRAYGEELSDQGFDKAYDVLAVFLILKKSKKLFMKWLKTTAGVKSNHAKSCFNCLNEWCEQMGEKKVTKLAGIGRAYGEELSDQGFDKAYDVLAVFLILKKSKKLFMKWLKTTAGVKSNHAKSCFNCLNEWCELHL